jgi:6-phosphogluconolactonase
MSSLDNVFIFSDPDALANKLALRLKEEAEWAVNENRVYSVVLSGGATASKLYKRLRAPGIGELVPWHVVHLFWADERCVPLASQESNYTVAKRSFIDSISIPNKNIHRIRGEEEPFSESVRYGREIIDHMALRHGGNLFDWVLLGVGNDGHTASLFPMHETSISSKNICEEVRHPQTGQKRITLTPFALRQSTSITYHVIGEGKSHIVDQLLKSGTPTSDYPVTQISGEWYLDQSAASKCNLF